MALYIFDPDAGMEDSEIVESLKGRKKEMGDIQGWLKFIEETTPIEVSKEQESEESEERNKRVEEMQKEDAEKKSAEEEKQQRPTLLQAVAIVLAFDDFVSDSLVRSGSLAPPYYRPRTLPPRGALA